MDWKTCSSLAEKRGLHTFMQGKEREGLRVSHGFFFFVAHATFKVYGINGMEGAT
jgi:hypothetical protein